MGSNYLEVAGYGRGSRTDSPYTVAFEMSIRKSEVKDGIRGLSPKSGLIVKRINGGGKPISGFINITELNTMKAKVRYAQNKILETNCCAATDAVKEYVFPMGTFKGKTPSQLLLSGTAESELLSQREFLEKNATGKFAEANKEGIAAINDAVMKFRAGTLVASEVKDTAITLFQSGPKYFPLAKTQPYETEGWELKIICFPGNKNPFSIEWQSKKVVIENNVIVSAKDVQSHNAALTEVEFVDMYELTMEKIKTLENADIFNRIAYAETHKFDYKSGNGNNNVNARNSASDVTLRANDVPKQNDSDDDMPFK